MKRGDREGREPSQCQCAQPVFGLWHAPTFPLACWANHAIVEQGHTKGEHLTKSLRSLVHPLHQALISAQDTIKKLTCESVTLRQEIARLTLENGNTPAALEELMSLYTQAKKEKEEMNARIKKMEKDFQTEKKTWQDLGKYQLGEISSFRMKWLVAQSDSHQMEQEVIESKRELYEGRKQVEREITSLEESLRIQREETAARLSAMEDHWREVIRIREDNATMKLRESEEQWQNRVSQLEGEMMEKRSSVSSLMDKMMGEHQNTMNLLSQKLSEFCQREQKRETKCNALEERYRKELAELEESWQRRVEEMERKNELEKMWLQKEEEWRQNISALQKEVKCLTKESTQCQGHSNKKKKQKQWWRRRLRFRRRQANTGGTAGDTALLLAQPEEK